MLNILYCFLQVFAEWNKGELDSFLIEITRDILKYKDVDGNYNVFIEPEKMHTIDTQYS